MTTAIGKCGFGAKGERRTPNARLPTARYYNNETITDDDMCALRSSTTLPDADGGAAEKWPCPGPDAKT
ncbi:MULTISPECIES: hypothetical protein, partial [Streptomyces]